MTRGMNVNVSRRPRVLVTGFEPFPGAPENPTEKLITALAAKPEAFAEGAALHLEVLPVDYKAVPERLVSLAREVAPDIAVHFGLSAQAQGFTLERRARNEIRAEKPDNRGECGQAGPIREGAGDFASTLPLEDLEQALWALDLPVYWSDDAGGYLCNYLFYLSRGHFCSGFAPAISGFIHVPPLGTGPGDMTMDALQTGAVAIVETCCRKWKARSLASV